MIDKCNHKHVFLCVFVALGIDSMASVLKVQNKACLWIISFKFKKVFNSAQEINSILETDLLCSIFPSILLCTYTRYVVHMPLHSDRGTDSALQIIQDCVTHMPYFVTRVLTVRCK